MALIASICSSVASARSAKAALTTAAIEGQRLAIEKESGEPKWDPRFVISETGQAVVIVTNDGNLDAHDVQVQVYMDVAGEPREVGLQHLGDIARGKRAHHAGRLGDPTPRDES